MSRKLYVGNLPYTATESDLTNKFTEFGTVESIKLITDRDTGQSKGFGFVEMASNAEGRAAIEKLNGADYEGRAMNVNEAKPKGDKGGRGAYGGGGGGGYGGGGRW
jgi:RNA recognition motif-containing protein